MQSIYRRTAAYPHLARTSIQHNLKRQSDAESGLKPPLIAFD